jgi:hypothetical protein
MISDFATFVFIECAWFAQDRAAHSDLADVVQDSADSQIEDPLLVESAVPACNHFGVPFDTVTVSGRVRILRFDGSCVCSNRGNEHLPHLLFVPRFARLDQLMKVSALPFVGQEYLPALGCSRQTHFELAERERLAQEVKGARPHCFNCDSGIRLTGQQHRHDGWVNSGKMLDEFDSADTGHSDVRVHKPIGRRIQRHPFQCRAAIFRYIRLEPPGCKRFRQCVPAFFLIINH